MTCFIRFFFFPTPHKNLTRKKLSNWGGKICGFFSSAIMMLVNISDFAGRKVCFFFVRTRLSKFPRGHSNRGENVLKYSHRVRKLAEKRIIKGGARTEKKSSAIKTMGNQQFEDKSLTAPGGVAFRSTDRCGMQIGPG